jgi:thioredoxin reductase
MKTWDVIIIGAGPAGLSAALILGRCCRQVLLCDRGTPRNRASHAIHGYLANDGIHPAEFRRIALKDLERYPGICFRADEAKSAERVSELEFAVTFVTGVKEHTRKLLLATGLQDELPPIKGVEQFFGTSVFSCPYCDAWEVRDGALAVYGHAHRGFEMARSLTGWSDHIVLCTDGPTGLSKKQRSELEQNGVRIESERIAGLRGEGDQLQSVVLETGRELPCTALFFNTPTHPQSHLAKSLGCQFTSAGGIKCGQYEASSVAGVFVAGNITKDVQLSIAAAAEGARAAFGINRALTRESFAASVKGTIVKVEHQGPA